MSGTMILPGVYISVLSEGLIAPGQITVGNLGVVGTAARGPVGQPVLLADFNDAIATFGSYDAFTNPAGTAALTLTRALELAFGAGASVVYAMRVGTDTGSAAYAAASRTLASAGGPCVTLTANSPGSWGNAITVSVIAPAASDVLTLQEVVTLTAAQATAQQITLGHASVAATAPSFARNRVIIRKLDGSVHVPAVVGAAPLANQAEFNGATLVFGDTVAEGDVVTAGYAVAASAFVNVTLTLGTFKETYLVTDGQMLVAKTGDPQSGSTLVTAAAAANVSQLPSVQVLPFSGGQNGEAFTGYGATATYDPLLDVDAHIILAAGQPHTVAGAALDQHCQKASTDVFKRDRIAVVGADFAASGTRPPTGAQVDAFVNLLLGNTLGSDRVILMAPGIQATSSAADDQAVNPIMLPAAYTAAVIAGMLAAFPPHISLTNKPVGVTGLETSFNIAQLTELVQNRVTALEVSRGIRVLRGQTTDDGAFREITTRRIVDYAKYGVRAAAGPFIGLLNNDRVRTALRTTINSFLKGMLEDEMLVDYGLDVSATRDQQISGIVQVTITLQPVFSINFIKVTMILS
jgi:Phage tail sheath C-terminal domain